MTRSRQLAAIMFTDIEGYTTLMQKNEKSAIQAREKHRQIFNSITAKHKGRVLQYYGDGTLSIFNSAIDAVTCGIEMQLGFQKDPSIPVRIGIHTGDIIFSEEEIIGDSVNVASRLESLAVSGSVFISDKVYDEIKNQESIKTSLLKTFKLKNIEKPIEVYAISNVGLIVPKLEDIKGKTDLDPASISEKQKKETSNIQKAGTSILATKLYIPPPRPKAVHRSRLIEQLNKGRHGKLTLISAAAGFGKTTLASEWVTTCGRQAAWLSLDEGDNDLPRFLNYLVAALKTIEVNISDGVLGGLQSPQQPPTESILTSLLNEISTVRDNFFLVFDDYHVINAKPVDDVLNFLVEHLPPQMHLVITTREDPGIPLARLRVRNQLTELRAADLRFTPTEAAEFLNQVMGLNLLAGDISALETRTEGWIAGLQLAALSMQGRADISGFVRAFAGHNRYIVDYLGEEVLRSQTEHTRNFLLQTSMLNRLNGSLCDAVTGQEDGKGMLENLERANLFIVPLDDERQWYRYHHLFSDVLQARLMEQDPSLTITLNQRASTWYEQNDSLTDAVHHALVARDFQRTANLAELAWPAMDRSCQSATWLGWVRKLPDELISFRPVLSAAYAWALLENGHLEDCEIRLRDAEKWLDTAAEISEEPKDPSSGMVVVDKEQFRNLPVTITNARAYLAQVLGDVLGTEKYARQALDLSPEGDHLQRGIPAVLLGFAQWRSGDLESAYQSFIDVMASFKSAGDISAAISPTFVLANIRIAQGRLNEAVATYEQALQLAKEQGDSLPRGTSELYLGLSELCHEMEDLELARKYLLKSEKLGEQLAPANWDCRDRWCIAHALLKKTEGDLKGCMELLDEAERLYFRNPVPDVHPVAALKARVWLGLGRLSEAQGWVRKQGLSDDDDLSYLHEFEHITLAKVLIAHYKVDGEYQSIHKAKGLLERLLKASEEGGRTGSFIEILILQALAYHAQGDMSSALKSLERALVLAEPEGYVRIFVDEGVPMAQLLNNAASHEILPEYIKKLQNVIEAEEEKS